MPDPTPPAGTPTPRTTGGSKRWQPPTPAELQALLPDDYTVEKLLGRGGMGAVYQGRRLSLDRPVAIKILSTDLEDSDTRYVERFKNEARAMAQLSHPGIVGVYGFGETADGLLYIVMEFIEGTDVYRMIKEQGRLRTEHAMAITAHVCDALAFAHERGIIHRDIKPANIMVGYDGVVKVADFGLAKMTVDGATLGLTKSGMAMGTLHYMAPETLILGTAADHRADIYAVGVMLYQMLTGKLPQGVVDPPSEQVPGLDPRFDVIIAKAMSEDRDERYQSVRELRSDLDKTLTKPVVKVEAEAAPASAALTTTARPQRPEGQHSRAPKITAFIQSFTHRLFAGRAVVLLVMLAVIVTGGYLWLNQSPASSKPTLATSSSPIATQPSTIPANERPSLRLISTTPASPATLSLGQRLSIEIEYNNPWSDPMKIRTTLYSKGAPAKKVKFSAPSVSPSGRGSTMEWFYFDQPTEVDEARVEMNGSSDKEYGNRSTFHSISLPIRAVWKDASSPSQEPASQFLNTQPLSAATKAQPFVNSLGMKFVPVPGTSNLMCIHETRKQDYAAFATENPTVDGSWQNPKTTSGVAVSFEDNHPVVKVNWDDAKAFCAWLGKKEGRNYRLPTDHEWSFAVGIGADELPVGTPSDLNQKIKNVYPWGNAWPPSNKVGNYADIYALLKFPTHGVIDGYTDGFGTTAPVMSFPANALGIYDLGGNVLEWCEEWYNTKQDTRVMRGGAWLGYGNNFLQSACRYPVSPDKRHHENGFRCLLANAPPTNNAGTKSSEPGTGTGTGTGTQLPLPPAGMACIPEGSFQMGDSLGRTRDAPVHQLTLGTFFMDRHEVYQEQWQNVHDWGAKHGYRISDGGSKASRHPVHGITWYDAVKWCNARSEKESLTPCYYTDTAQTLIYRTGVTDVSNTMTKWAANGYRLPTEAEWEKAARGGLHGKRYPWGDSITGNQANYNGSGDVFEESTTPCTTPVGNYDGSQFPSGVDMANGYGLYDMAGNVREWCWDWYSNNAVDNDTNTHGPMNGSYRVLRGGSWDYDSSVLGCGYRTFYKPSVTLTNIGFRCVLNASPNSAALTTTSAPPPTTRSGTSSASKQQTWIDDKGKIITAEFVRQEGGNVLLKMRDSIYRVSLDRLSPDSRKLAEQSTQLGQPNTAGAMATQPPAPMLSLATTSPPTANTTSTNSLGMKFVPVPGIDVLFCIHETRRQDYAAYAAVVPSVDSSWKNQQFNGLPIGQANNHPVVGVNWEDAKGFCVWLSKKEGKTYRLPTDKEWSHAVGIGEKETRTEDTMPESLSGKLPNEFPWGGAYPPKTENKNGNYGDTSFKEKITASSFITGYTDGFSTTAPVMNFQPNKHGIYDLGGNVWEWCEDRPDKSQHYRVLRGASWSKRTASDLLSSRRFNGPQTMRADDSGFRCVMEK